jgi:hypothetical protein
MKRLSDITVCNKLRYAKVSHKVIIVTLEESGKGVQYCDNDCPHSAITCDGRFQCSLFDKAPKLVKYDKRGTYSEYKRCTECIKIFGK